MKFFKKIVLALFGIALLASSSLPGVFAQSVEVGLPAFKITMNDIRIDNSERLYPIIVFRDITYVPMTYNDSRFLGLETKWDADSGLEVNKITDQMSYKPDRGYSSSSLESAVLPNFRIRVNGKEIDNGNAEYPLLVFRDITYFPLTWRYMVDDFGWTSTFDMSNGLVISSKPSQPGTTTGNTGNKVYSRDFGNITVIFDRYANNQPGNLSVRENNSTRKIGNPNYIYGVSYARLAIFEAYNAVNNLSFSNRWVYVLAIDPNVSPIKSKNVRVNIDTNEVQLVN